MIFVRIFHWSNRDDCKFATAKVCARDPVGRTRGRDPCGNRHEGCPQNDVGNDGWNDEEYDAKGNRERRLPGYMTENDAELR
jgi:hypothetical protein